MGYKKPDANHTLRTNTLSAPPRPLPPPPAGGWVVAVAEAKTRVPPFQQAHRDALVAVPLQEVVRVLIDTAEIISDREKRDQSYLGGEG